MKVWIVLLGLTGPLQAYAIDPKIAALDKDKFTVCTASINSTLEREVFKSRLSSGKNQGAFQFVELTELGTPAGQTRGVVANWFDRACKSGVKCDILMISAHYSSLGYFSDKENENPLRYPLSTAATTKHACEKTCEGILANPAQTFLMVCNALASKKADHRTKPVYIEVLKKDGARRSRAERAAEDRYGELGPTNHEQTRFTFAGVNRIVGFKSTSALAETSSEYLEKYFDRFPDYSQQLQIEATTRLNSGLQSVQKVSSDDVTRSMNQALTASFTNSSVCLSSGNFPEGSEQAEVWRNICALRDESTPVPERLKLIRGLLQSPEIAKYIPDIADFVSSHLSKRPVAYPITIGGPIVPSSPPGQDEFEKLLAEISKLEFARNFVEQQIEKKEDMPTLKLQLLKVAKAFRWMPGEVAATKIHETRLQIENDPDWPREFDL